jgi:hypothetical protein
VKSKPTRGGARKGAGRKPSGMQRINVLIADSHIDKARRIGEGNVSLGVRKALDKVLID